MAAKKELLTATDWMAYYEKLFRDDNILKAGHISTNKDGKKGECLLSDAEHIKITDKT